MFVCGFLHAVFDFFKTFMRPGMSIRENINLAVLGPIRRWSPFAVPESIINKRPQILMKYADEKAPTEGQPAKEFKSDSKSEFGTQDGRKPIKASPVKAEAETDLKSPVLKSSTPAKTTKKPARQKDPKVVWQRVKKRLRATLGEDIFTSWFARMEIEEICGNVVHHSVPTRFLRSWIVSHYEDKVLEIWKAEINDIDRLHLTVRVNGQARPRLNPPQEDIQKSQPAFAGANIGAQPKNTAPRDALSGSILDKKMTFDAFVLGQSNILAHAAAKQVAGAALNNSVAFNPLYIHSPVGLGKTHLMTAIAWAAGGADRTRNIVYLTAEHFMYHFITAVQRQSAIGFKEWLRRIDLLLIDDMQFLQGKSATEFGHTLNALITGAKQVVVAGDRAPCDLEMLDERMRSRLSGGLVVEIDKFNIDLRRAIVQKRAEIHMQRNPDIHISSFVLDHVARNIISNGRDLDGAINRLVAANQLTGETISIEMADRALRDLMRSRETRRVKIEEIQRVVSKHFAVSKADLLSSRRARAVVRPRQIAMYLSKQLTPRSLPEIGRRFGGRDHTTVLHAVRKVEELMSADIQLGQEVELLKRMLEE